jgi:TPR repeat protein
MIRAFKLTVAVLILVTGLAGSVAAGPRADEAAAYLRGDYATAFLILRPLADQGDATAQAVVGPMYAAGQGVPQSHPAAVILLRKAADQGVAIAQFELGRISLNSATLAK